MSVPMTTAGRALETAVIEVAEAYATTNGHDGTGEAFLAGYLGAFPDARDRIEGWAARLDAAARDLAP